VNNKGREESKNGMKRREETDNNTFKYKSMGREREATKLTGDKKKRKNSRR
jgi:hypothetical protein